MEQAFGMMSFARLREGDVRYIERVSTDAAERSRLLQMLHKYLYFLGSGENPDDEKLFVLGRELRTVWPHKFHQELVTSVKENVNENLAEIFLTGFEAAENSSKQLLRPRLPSKREFEELISEIGRHSFHQIQDRIRAFMEKHLSYSELTGDARLLTSVTIQIGESILRMSGNDRWQGASLIRELTRSALRWEPWNGHLWYLWSRGFLAQGATEAAELVLWESIRRIPPNQYARTQLVGLLDRSKERKREAVELARETVVLIPNNEVVYNVLARILLDTGDTGDRREGIKLLIDRLRVAPTNHAHCTLLAKALGADFHLTKNAAEYYRSIVSMLPNNQELIVKMARVMTLQLANFDVAEALLRAGLSYDNSPLLMISLARVLLRESRRDEAIGILRKAKDLYPDIYIKNHLAEALASSGDPDGLIEATEILNAITQDALTDNETSRALLATITAPIKVTSQGGSPQIDFPNDEENTVFQENNGNESSTDAIVTIKDVQLEKELPAQFISMAQTSRLSFRLAHAHGAMKSAAVKELRQILRDDPTFSYAQLLAVRQGIWEAEGKTLPSFPAAFELALMTEDSIALSRLAKEHPRLEALTIFARAALGDKESIGRVQNLLEKPFEAKFGIEKMLREKVGPTFQLVAAGRLDSSSLEKAKHQLVNSLREINEWAIGDGDWRLAA
jgi:tetratricopeptide (TPR) repeat protein